MRKTDKKLDNQIRETLTLVCDDALEQIAGFQWLTHSVNYDNFPNTLKITCVFDTAEELSNFNGSENKAWLTDLIRQRLGSINVSLKNAGKHITFDTEEACTNENDGNWARQLS
ncbi:Fis family transcriptional regulator [Vibrio amylolyticus]|uniref:Fis family transcriptional regulator n=1 Tax=Vibrio amylolyticus TaxID=2847292 RepID=UPI00354B6791